MNTTALPGCCRGILGWGLDKEGDCTIRRFLQLVWLPSMSSCSWGGGGARRLVSGIKSWSRCAPTSLTTGAGAQAGGGGGGGGREGGNGDWFGSL